MRMRKLVCNLESDECSWVSILIVTDNHGGIIFRTRTLRSRSEELSWFLNLDMSNFSFDQKKVLLTKYWLKSNKICRASVWATKIHQLPSLAFQSICHLLYILKWIDINYRDPGQDLPPSLWLGGSAWGGEWLRWPLPCPGVNTLPVLRH